MSCGVGRRHGSDLTLLHRLAVTAPIRPLAWEPPYAVGVAPKSKKKKKKELQLLAYTTGIATPGPSHISSLCQSLRQLQILNPLSETRDQTHTLMDTSQILNPLSHTGIPTAGSFNSQ